MDTDQRIKAAQCVLIVAGIAAYRTCFKGDGHFNYGKVLEYSRLLGKLVESIKPEDMN